MARIRSIKPEFWDDEAIGRLSNLARLNFIGLISMADDRGRGRAGTVYLLRRLHPHSMSIHEQLMESSLKELEDSLRVQFYSVNSENFYCIKNFEKHQRINRPSPSQLPEPSLNPPERSVKCVAGEEGRGGEWSGTEWSGTDRGGAPDSPSASAPGDPAEEPRPSLAEIRAELGVAAAEVPTVAITGGRDRTAELREKAKAKL